MSVGGCVRTGSGARWPAHDYRSLVALAAVALLTAWPWAASAHEHRTIAAGQLDVVVGWEHEPPFVNQPNAIGVRLSRAGTNPAEAIAGADSTLRLRITREGASRELPLRGVLTQPGYYLADLIPTSAGTYDLTLVGTAGGINVNEPIASGASGLEAVQPSTEAQFPAPLADPAEATRVAAAATAEAHTARLFAYAGLGIGALGLIAALLALASRPRAARAASRPVSRRPR